MFPTIRFVVVTALRDRLFASILAVAVVALGISVFLGGAAVAEGREMMAVYAAGGVRIVLVMGLSIFVAFHVERLHESREIEAILSRPISREKFVAAYWLGVTATALLAIAPLVAIIAVMSPSPAGALWWGATIAMECVIVVAFALFAALIMERAIPAIFATAGFYMLARLVGFFLGIAEGGRQAGVNSIANPIFEVIALMIPRVDLMGQTQWLVYGWDGIGIVGVLTAQTVIYASLLLAAACFDLRRKHF